MVRAHDVKVEALDRGVNISQPSCTEVHEGERPEKVHQKASRALTCHRSSLHGHTHGRQVPDVGVETALGSKLARQEGPHELPRA